MFKKMALIVVVLLCLGVIAFYVWPQPKYKPTQPNETFLNNAKSFHVTPMPPDWRFKDFNTADGRRLRWGETGNQGAAKASLALVPGYSGTLEMYGEQIDMLAERGYHVIGFEPRGMGGGDRDNPKQPEQMNPSDFKTYSDDFAAFYKAHIAPLEGDKAVLALSFGAHLSMRAVAEHDLDVQAFVASAPALRLLTGSDISFEKAVKGMKLMRILGRGEYVLPGTGNWAPYSDDLTLTKECGSHPARLYRRDVILADRPDLRIGGPTINWVLELTQSGNGYMVSDDFKKGFDVPSRFILADTDRIIDSGYAEDLCNDIATCEQKETRSCFGFSTASMSYSPNSSLFQVIAEKGRHGFTKAFFRILWKIVIRLTRLITITV